MLGIFRTAHGWEVQNVDRELVAGPFPTQDQAHNWLVQYFRTK
jgi:hypothetical protein